MLEKGSLVLIPNDALNIYLRERVTDNDRLLLEEIIDYCKKYETIATFLFINWKKGTYKCSAYMPIYNNNDKLKEQINNFKDIGQSIFIGSITVKNVNELKDEELLSRIKARATRLGFWNETYAVLVLHNLKPRKQVTQKNNSTKDLKPQTVKNEELANKMQEQSSDNTQIERFALGLKGVFRIIPLGKFIANRFLLIAGFIAGILISVINSSFPDKEIFYIEMVNNLIISIIPPLLGFSIAGFAIILNQSNEVLLSAMTDPEIKMNRRHSIFQKNYAAFSITMLAQSLPLIVAVFIKLIKPISYEIPVSIFMANIGNTIAIFFELLCFLFALFSIINLIMTIFNTGQIISFANIKKIKTKA